MASCCCRGARHSRRGVNIFVSRPNTASGHVLRGFAPPFRCLNGSRLFRRTLGPLRAPSEARREGPTIGGWVGQSESANGVAAKVQDTGTGARQHTKASARRAQTSSLPNQGWSPESRFYLPLPSMSPNLSVVLFAVHGRGSWRSQYTRRYLYFVQQGFENALPPASTAPWSSIIGGRNVDDSLGVADAEAGTIVGLTIPKATSIGTPHIRISRCRSGDWTALNRVVGPIGRPKASTG